MAQLAALDALRAAQIPFRSNIRFIWEGEEEAGSPHLEAILNANRDLVHGDAWLVCDGPVDQSGNRRLFSARGETRTSRSQSSVRSADCTADITAIGRGVYIATTAEDLSWVGQPR